MIKTITIWARCLSITVIFVTVSRVDLIKEDLTVKLTKECLDQLKDTLIEFFTLSAIFLLFIYSDIASMLCCRLAERGLLNETCYRMSVYKVHRNCFVALWTQHFLIFQIDRHDYLLVAFLLEAPLRAHVILTIAWIIFRDITLFVAWSQIAELWSTLHTGFFTWPKLINFEIYRSILAFALVDVWGMDAVEIRSATSMHLFATFFKCGNTCLIGLISIIRVVIWHVCFVHL